MIIQTWNCKNDKKDKKSNFAELVSRLFIGVIALKTIKFVKKNVELV